MRAPSERDFLAEADHAEGAGDLTLAVSLLRAHLGLDSANPPTRLRLGRLLLALGERMSARQILEPLEQIDEQIDDDSVASRANRLLAELDEADGSLGSAILRWERCLADDIDDVQARARLAELGAAGAERPWLTELSFGTLMSPESVRTSRFRLIRELGRGSTASVYLVRDERLDLPLALKVLHPQLAATTRARAREKFFLEARFAARLRHPGVVAIYGIDEASRCLAMEFIAGGTLRDRLRSPEATGAGQSGPSAGLAPYEVLATARSLLEALSYVHGAGIVHGDLKPGNILLRQPTEIVLADFGVAALAATDPASEDRPAGTPLYLAPEQFRGEPASPRTDLFAAGAILWELCRGQPARRQFLSQEAPAPDPIALGTLSLLGSAGERLAVAIAALMSADPAARPTSATAALALLG